MEYGKILTVFDLTNKIKDRLETSFPFVWVQGQVANLSRASSGHVYFSLKDSMASLSAVWFRSNQRQNEAFDPLTGEVFENGSRKNLALTLKNGQEIICAGQLTVYPARGTYQLIVNLAQDVGIGRLHVEFEILKEKLHKLGFFSSERKRSLPKYPTKVAIITAASGAAIHDFLKIAASRGFGGTIRIYPSLMQGDMAADNVLSQICAINKENWAEVIVLIRGGGSLEDLWSFNDEQLAACIRDSHIPILAGIGHEVDYTLADMTADVRAATPTHAAQLIWPDRKNFLTDLHSIEDRMDKAILSYFNQLEVKVEQKYRIVVANSPFRLFEAWEKQISALSFRLHSAITNFLDRTLIEVEHIEQIILRSSLAITTKRRILESLEQQLFFSRERFFSDKISTLEKLILQLEGFSPLRPLERGYSLVYTSNGNLVKNIADVSIGETLDINVSDGTISVIVSEQKKGNS